MIDQHIHTKYSPDSTEEIQNYINKAKLFNDPYINITDHFDIFDNLKDLVSFTDHDFFYELNHQYDNFDFNQDMIKLGLEIGFNENHIDVTKDFIKDKNYSILLLSVHELDSYSIIWHKPETYQDRYSKQEVVALYYDQMYKAITSGIDYDILTHMGYVLRYVEGVNFRDYEEDIIKILKEIIKQDKGLEVNTGCMRYDKYDTRDFYTYLLDLYYNLGGEKVSISSDAHNFNDYNARFLDAIDIVKRSGFKKLLLVHDRVHSFIDIESFKTNNVN